MGMGELKLRLGATWPSAAAMTQGAQALAARPEQASARASRGRLRRRAAPMKVREGAGLQVAADLRHEHRPGLGQRTLLVVARVETVTTMEKGPEGAFGCPGVCSSVFFCYLLFELGLCGFSFDL
jgi:hypothetical protein